MTHSNIRIVEQLPNQTNLDDCLAVSKYRALFTAAPVRLPNVQHSRSRTQVSAPKLKSVSSVSAVELSPKST